MQSEILGLQIENSRILDVLQNLNSEDNSSSYPSEKLDPRLLQEVGDLMLTN